MCYGGYAGSAWQASGVWFADCDQFHTRTTQYCDHACQRSAAWEETQIMCTYHDWGTGLLCCFWPWEKDLNSGSRQDTKCQINCSTFLQDMSDKSRAVYKTELETWIANGWLILYPQQWLDLPRGLILLMAVTQVTKAKVQPVMDYREINHYVDAFTADTDMCAKQKSEWWQQRANMALLDLQKAHLQIWIHEMLWPFQTVIIKGWRYCLTVWP